MYLSSILYSLCDRRWCYWDLFHLIHFYLRKICALLESGDQPQLGSASVKKFRHFNYLSKGNSSATCSHFEIYVDQCDKISPLGQILSRFHFFVGLFRVWPNFEPSLANLVCYWANFYAIGQILIALNSQKSNK